MQHYDHDHMIIDKDIPVPLRDGAVVLANVFRPKGDGPWPVILNYSPYGKDVHFRDFMPAVWQQLQEEHPEITAASSLRHLTFESADPEVWTRFGYVVVRVDSRGAGKSPGLLHPNSPDEFDDACDAVEWAGEADWSNGRVGLLGISYYASGQWMIAARKPRHLAAIQPWQGTCDFYRDRTRQGGIMSSGFVRMWWERCVAPNQHGNGDSPFLDYFTGERNTGPALSAEELAANRHEYVEDVLAHPLEDQWYQARSADLSAIDVPALVVANWGGLQVHLRGTLLGFEGISSPEKWLRIQRGSYFLSFYHPDNVALQRRFFDRYLKGDRSAWSDDETAVEAVVRSMSDGVDRVETAATWPLPHAVEHRLHLDVASGALAQDAPTERAGRTFAARSGAVVFSTGPLTEDLELAGPILLRIIISSSTEEADVFATLQAFDAEGNEASFESVGDPTSSMARSPLSQGWLRVSHRGVDPARSGFLRPFHHHRVHEPLVPGRPYDVEIELWPASLAIPAGSELRLTLTGRDFVRDSRGIGTMGHDDPRDRPDPAFSGDHTLHTGPGIAAYLALPRIGTQA